MIQIYCLVNPFTDTPFYVGSTSSALTSRLAQHVAYAVKNKRWLNHSHDELKHFPARLKRCDD
jgi:hypothetical protein